MLTDVNNILFTNVNDDREVVVNYWSITFYGTRKIID